MKMTADDHLVDAEQVIAGSPELDTMEAVARLAAMPPIEYDRVREVEAERLNVRVSTLDKEVAMARRRGHQSQAGDADDEFLIDPEPWPEPVDGADLLDRIASMANAHLVLPMGGAEAMALWIIHAHAHDCFFISPVLSFTSPTPECGKTTCLTYTGALVPRACPSSNITTAALFRAVEKWQPTLLIDEADTFLKSSDDLRGVLNSGHQRANAFVLRTAGDDHEPRRFRTWAPKAVALIGKLPPTLASRAVNIELRRKMADEDVRPLRADRLDHLIPLRRQAARWVADNVTALRSADPEMPRAISGRAADNWRPLIAIADVAGGEWPARARRVAVELGGSRGEQTASVMLLEDVQQIFATEGVDRIQSQELAAKLAKIEERPWVEWKNDRPITPRQIAKLLEQFKVKPDTIRTSVGTAKGYMLEDFTDAFARYTAYRSVTPEHCSEIKDLRSSRSVTLNERVTDKNHEKPNKINGCYAVTDGKTPPGQKGQCADCGEGERLGDEMLEAYTGACKSWLHRSCGEAQVTVMRRPGNGVAP
jgi:putative DNA primase/helicase